MKLRVRDRENKQSGKTEIFSANMDEAMMRIEVNEKSGKDIKFYD